jgi:hypothetical protein
MSSTEVEIYPNPVEGEFVIAVSSLANEKVTIEFVNANGMLALSKMYDMSNGFNQYNFNSQELISGIYFVRVFTNDTQIIKKLIVK